MAPKVATKTKAVKAAVKPVVEVMLDDEEIIKEPPVGYKTESDDDMKEASDSEVKLQSESEDVEGKKEVKEKVVKEKKTKAAPAAPKEKKEVKEKADKPKKTKKVKTTSDEEKEAVIESDDGDNKEKKRKGSVPVDLIKQMMEENPEVMSGVTIKTAKAICECYMKTIFEKVKNGDNVTLTNWMTFKRALRAERTHCVPSKKKDEDEEKEEKKKIVKPAHYVMTIDVKPALKAEFEEIETA